MSQIESGQQDKIRNISDNPRYRYYGSRPVLDIDRYAERVLPRWDKVQFIGFLAITAVGILGSQLPPKFWERIFNR